MLKSDSNAWNDCNTWNDWNRAKVITLLTGGAKNCA